MSTTNMAGNEVRLVKNKKAKSKVWTYFNLKEDSLGTTVPNIAVCSLCDSEVRHAGGTTNLASHLRRHHGFVAFSDETCEHARSSNVLSDNRYKRQQTHTHMVATSTTTNPKYPAYSEMAQTLTNKLACFIIKGLLPYSVVDSTEFRDFVSSLDPRYEVPSRKELSDVVIPKMYDKTKTNVLSEIAFADQTAITTDVWMSRSAETYITITSIHITKEWQLKTFVLQTRPLPWTYTGGDLARLLSDVCCEWGIHTFPVPPIVSDNDGNIIQAGHLLGCEMHFKCFAQTVNIAAQKSLNVKAVYDILAKIRKLVVFFNSSKMASTLLQNQADLFSLTQHKLVNDVCTRWNSIYDMLARFLEIQNAVSGALRSKELGIVMDSDMHNLSDEETTLAEDVVECLRPLKTVTSTLCTEGSTTLSTILPIQHKLIDMDLTIQDTDGSSIKEMKNIIKNELTDSYSHQEDILSVVTALDPRFKSLPFLSEEGRHATYNSMVARAADLDNKLLVEVKTEPGMEDQTQTQPQWPGMETFDEDTYDHGKPTSPKKAKCDSNIYNSTPSKSTLQDILGDVFVSPVEMPMKKSSLDLIEEEVLMYKQLLPIPLQGNPLLWWKTNEHKMPHIARLAKSLLCIPGTSVPSERVFSTTGDVLMAQRASLKGKHADKLLFLKTNM
ncbi:zinc finger BED domain-containing protein 1-like [Mizuhopecten yessoensis]|uniref:zinc finger BED domain-containing protein 1-like n=1 Tax=Mizuhopecten yessoensis TaxID=6573 RepID=UPI000B45962D|nr:zinc finger BED domain-containing protein 1-like [Mizuhopecten yessoensis]